MPTPIESAVYSFEGLLPELESPPIAARRALDHAGLRLTVDGWRSLSVEDRERVTVAGVPERVDADLVASLLRHATPTPQKIAPASDPEPSTPPEALVKALEPHQSIDAKRWAKLRAIDRYALAYTYRRAVARSAFSLLGDALDAVLLATVPTPYQGDARPSPSVPPNAEAAPRSASAPPGSAYQPAGYYSSFGSAAGEPPPPRDHAPRTSFPPPPTGSTPPQPMAALPHETPTTPRSMVPGAALFSHFNEAGRVHLLDVARKPKTERRAVARGSVRMRPETLSRLAHRDSPKGEVLAAARLAAILAAKRTHEILPLCHVVSLTHLDVSFDLDAVASVVQVTAMAEAYDRTGCEMEALVAVSTACLTVYDMLKSMDHEMVISDVMLMEKSGGRSSDFRRHEP